MHIAAEVSCQCYRDLLRAGEDPLGIAPRRKVNWEETLFVFSQLAGALVVTLSPANWVPNSDTPLTAGFSPGKGLRPRDKRLVASEGRSDAVGRRAWELPEAGKPQRVITGSL